MFCVTQSTYGVLKWVFWDKRSLSLGHKELEGFQVHRLIMILKAFGVAFTGLIVAFWLAWWILAQMNFSYRHWHGFGEMGPAIDRLSQTNVIKSGFEKTTLEQRSALFEEIMDCVHEGGAGLDALTFKVPGEREQVLLTEAEIIHLKDVANLIQLGFYIALIALVLWLAQWFYYGIRRAVLPSFRLQLITNLAFVALSTAVVFAIGPMKVFYQLHVWLFPPDNQWYFYFKESLMATLMYAPTFFGWVAIEWLIIALIVFPLIQFGPVFVMRRMHRQR